MLLLRRSFSCNKGRSSNCGRLYEPRHVLLLITESDRLE